MKLYQVGSKKGKEFKNYQIDLSEAHIMAKNGLMALSVMVGMKVLSSMIEEEVVEKAGVRGKHDPDRQIYRHGSELSSVVLGGQKVKIEKPRLRSKDNKEVPVDILRQFQSEDALNSRMMKQMLMGITTRGYEEIQDGSEELDSFGASRSTVSRRFIKETSKEMNKFLSRKIEDDNYPVIMIDGVGFGDYLLIVALGVKSTGEKRILGIKEGSSENSEVCKGLIDDMIERGLKADEGRLFVLDGSKALSKAVKEKFSSHAHIQRCQIHKKRNVEGHLPDSMKDTVISEMNNAYAEFEYATAKNKLEVLAKSLEYKYPSAAASIREGLEETLTLHRLKLPGQLRQSLSSTNPIESAIGSARVITGRVRHWKSGSQVLRWLSCGFMKVESTFHRIKGYKLLPILINSISKVEYDGKQSAG